MKVRLYVPEDNQPQSVTVRVDGKVIGVWDTPYIGEKYADFTLVIKKDADRKLASLIEFEFAKRKKYAVFFGSVFVSPVGQ